MEKFFHLKENGIKVSTEIIAGLTTFFVGIYKTLCYSFSYSIARGFIFYIIVKFVKVKLKKQSYLLGMYRIICIGLCSISNYIINN